MKTKRANRYFMQAGILAMVFGIQVILAMDSSTSVQKANESVLLKRSLKIINLQKAIASNCLQKVKNLIEQGVSMETPLSCDKKTPIATAAFWWQSEIVEYLIEKKAEVNARDAMGRTPLHQLFRKNMMKPQKNETLSSPVIIKILKDAGADINACDNKGRTPLMYAASAGCLRELIILQAFGADLDLKDSSGKTALDHAQKRIGKNESLEEYKNRLKSVISFLGVGEKSK